MIHTFTVLGKYYLHDTESASFFEIDGLAFDALKALEDVNVEELVKSRSFEGFNSSGLNERYGEEAVRETFAEICGLYDKGLLFTDPVSRTPQKTDAIKSLCLHICHDCNLSCDYCFAGQGTYRGEREYMSPEVGKAAVDFLIESSKGRGNLEIDFFGGEPLMNLETVKDIVRYARGKEKEYNKVFKFTLTTNGLLLDDEAVKFLNDEMENVVLSLDGRQEVHDAVRKTVNGKGSFRLIADKFKSFREQRGEKSYYIRGTFTARNLDFAKDVLFIADMGFDQISVEPVVLPNHPLAIKEEHIPALCDEYEKLAAHYLERKKNGGGFDFFHFKLNLDGGPCLKRRITGCGAGSEYLAVSPKGELYPCHQFTGSKEYLLGDIFKGISNTELAGTFMGATVYSKPDCAACWAKYLCSGGCFANSINLGGGINKSYKIGCALMKKRLECALHLINVDADDKTMET